MGFVICIRRLTLSPERLYKLRQYSILLINLPLAAYNDETPKRMYGVRFYGGYLKAYSYLAKAYNELMSDVNYDSWAAYINELLGIKNARIFETACGTGNISSRLYDFGHNIIASDISDDMLREAAENSRRTGRDIKFVKQDMISFTVGNKVDAVVCACDGVNYIDKSGLNQFASAAFRSLKNGGLLLFDISTRSKLLTMDGQVYFDDSDDVSCIWRNAYDKARNTLTMDVTLFVRKGSLFERFSETHVQYAHETDAVRHTMMDAGFTEVSVYGFLTKDACTANAPRAQFVCRKT
jgi:SAM-dependent methyltransferase